MDQLVVVQHYARWVNKSVLMVTVCQLSSLNAVKIIHALDKILASIIFVYPTLVLPAIMPMNVHFLNSSNAQIQFVFLTLMLNVEQVLFVILNKNVSTMFVCQILAQPAHPILVLSLNKDAILVYVSLILS